MIRYITFTQPFLKKNYPCRNNAYKVFLTNCLSPKLNENQILKCELECELLKALHFMDNDKSPGNYGITK